MTHKEPTNQDRAQWALSALQTFADVTGLSIAHDGLEMTVRDFMADLAHLCDRDGLNLSDIIRAATNHYLDENPQGKQLAKDSYAHACAEPLQTETFNFAMQTRVCDAFKASKTYDSLDVHHIHAAFEHGQWWLIVTLNEGQDPDQITYSVVDAEGGDSVDGFDFEVV